LVLSSRLFHNRKARTMSGGDAGWRPSPSAVAPVAPVGPLYPKTAASAGRMSEAIDRRAFDANDIAPEDPLHARKNSLQGCPWPLDPRVPLVRGSLRLEGVNFARWESAMGAPERQRAITTALRDDMISEAGNGITREDILLRLTPGPIHSVLLDYSGRPRPDGQPALPKLSDAEWCIDIEYAIAARDEAKQSAIARALFEALAGGEMALPATRAAYIRYLNPTHPDPTKIIGVPTASAMDRERAAAVVTQQPMVVERTAVGDVVRPAGVPIPLTPVPPVFGSPAVPPVSVPAPVPPMPVPDSVYKHVRSASPYHPIPHSVAVVAAGASAASPLRRHT